MYVAAGIIPAHAGFTREGGRGGRSRRDHPRTRGVYHVGSQADELVGGSSPHTRGLLGRDVNYIEVCRIIPAHAGFTTRTRARGPHCRDHPRTRGVYTAPARPAAPQPGSSPHTRGLPVLAGEGHGSCRIIPAHAGFTAQAGTRCRGHRDHPRTRGVYRRADAGQSASPGSSPHTRGLPASVGAPIVL